MTVPSGVGHAFVFISDLRRNEKKSMTQGREGCWLAGPAAAGPARISGMSGACGVRGCGRGAQHQGVQGEAGRVDEQAGVLPGERAAAPVPVEVRQHGPGPGTAQELIDIGEQADQPGEAVLACPCVVIGAVHCACPGAAPNPAQAEVPGWTEYASSATAAGPASTSQARAPSPIARNAASASVTALTRGGRGVPSGCCGWPG